MQDRSENKGSSEKIVGAPFDATAPPLLKPSLRCASACPVLTIHHDFWMGGGGQLFLKEGISHKRFGNSLSAHKTASSSSVPIPDRAVGHLRVSAQSSIR